MLSLLVAPQSRSCAGVTQTRWRRFAFRECTKGVAGIGQQGAPLNTCALQTQLTNCPLACSGRSCWCRCAFAFCLLLYVMRLRTQNSELRFRMAQWKISESGFCRRGEAQLTRTNRCVKICAHYSLYLMSSSVFSVVDKCTLLLSSAYFLLLLVFSM